MTIDTPLTCYLCGITSDEFVTVDLMGCFKNQQEADNRFKEKFGRTAEGYLFVCNDCKKKHRQHALATEQKYGVYV